MCAPPSIFSHPRRTPTTVSRTVNSSNELTVLGSANLPYDNAGNLTSDASGNTLIYDAWNRLVLLENSSGIMVGTYRYDGVRGRLSGQRYWRMAGRKLAASAASPFRSPAGDGQFWSFQNPASTPDFVNVMGMPTTMKTATEYPWMMGGTTGVTQITRPAPGIDSNVGGSMEVVVQPGGIQIEWFYMP